jgi:protein SCO1/2
MDSQIVAVLLKWKEMKGLAILLLGILLAACSRPPAARQYELQGQIVAIEPARNEVTIRHEDIKGFMPGMTMPFTVRDATLLEGKQPGDLVRATLVVEEVSAHLSMLTTTGRAPLEAPAAVSDGPRILAPGEQVADALLVGDDGMPLPFSSLRGHRVALTFIYTRCPLPEFCPMMDRNFAAVQKTIVATPALADVRLITLTFDPEFDTPAILHAHARRRGADPAIWTFATGEPTEVERFASQFGVYVERNPQRPADIIHNLITAVVDPDGRLVKRHTGNDWTPADLVKDIAATPAPGR